MARRTGQQRAPGGLVGRAGRQASAWLSREACLDRHRARRGRSSTRSRGRSSWQASWRHSSPTTLGRGWDSRHLRRKPEIPEAK
eukprot:1298682-Alexandrium_andersonii.AAC.1